MPPPSKEQTLVLELYHLANQIRKRVDHLPPDAAARYVTDLVRMLLVLPLPDQEAVPGKDEPLVQPGDPLSTVDTRPGRSLERANVAIQDRADARRLRVAKLLHTRGDMRPKAAAAELKIPYGSMATVLASPWFVRKPIPPGVSRGQGRTAILIGLTPAGVAVVGSSTLTGNPGTPAVSDTLGTGLPSPTATGAAA